MHKSKWFSIILLVCFIAGLLGGCAPQSAAEPTNAPAPAATVAPANTEPPAAPTSEPEKKTKTVTDLMGNKVEVPLEVNRIVAIRGTCNMPEMLSALGAGEKLISGLCMKFDEGDIQLILQPQYTLNNLVAAGETGINNEELLALNPDLVIAWYDIPKVEKIYETGIPMIQLDLNNWEDLHKIFILLGEVTNKQENAAKLLAEMDRIEKLVREKVSTIPEEKKKKVVYVKKIKPVIVEGNDAHHTFLIEMTGAVNAMKYLPGYDVTVDLEQVLVTDPDIILVASNCAICMEEIRNSKQWQTLRAVKEKNVYQSIRGVFLWDQPGAENPLYLLWETSVQYPELLSKEDLINETKKYIHDFYNYDLTEADMKRMFNVNTIGEER